MTLFDDFLIVAALSAVTGIAVWITLSTDWGKRRLGHLHLPRRWADRTFLVLAWGYVILFTTLAILRYYTFHAGYLELNTSWDLGQYNQLIWNSLHGRLLQGTFVQDTATFLGKSFTPILLAFVPLYAVAPSPLILLVVQVLGLGLAGFPIYWFARKQLGHTLGLVVAATYYLNPGMQHIGLTEFHEIALAVPLLAFATFFLLRRHYLGFLVCLGLALLVKEEIGLIAIAFGVYIYGVHRQRRLGFALMVFSIVWVVLLLQVVIPFFRGAEYGGTFYYFGEGAIGSGGARYGYLGRSVPEILMTITTRPEIVWRAIWIPPKITYVLHLLVPLACLPIVGAEVFLFTLPTLGYSLLSTYPLQYEIRSYYFAPLLPFLFFALTVGLQRLIRRSASARVIQGALASVLIVSSSISYFQTAPGPFGRYFQPWRYVVEARTGLENQWLATIPSDAIVIGQNEFLAHLSNRRFLYEVPVIPDYRQADYMVFDSSKSWYRVHEIGYRDLMANGYFETVVAHEGFVIARRKPPDVPRTIHFGDALTFLGHSLTLTDTLRGGMTIRPVVTWRLEQPTTERYSIALSVWDEQGHLWATQDREPHEGVTPTDRWPVGKPIGDQYRLKLPPTMPAGTYQLVLYVHPVGDETTVLPRDEHGTVLTDWLSLQTIRIEKNKNSYLASQLPIERPLYVDMQEMRFLGSTHIPATVPKGAPLPIGLYWRARGKPQRDYLVALQVRDAKNQVVWEQSAHPANGTYPTTQWDAGEVLLDWHKVVLPANVPAGTYDLGVQLLDSITRTKIGETWISTFSVVD